MWLAYGVGHRTARDRIWRMSGKSARWRRVALARWYGEYKPLPCPKCRGKWTVHRGYAQRGVSKVQRWKCRDCGRNFLETKHRTGGRWKSADTPRCFCGLPVANGRRRYCSAEHQRTGSQRKWESRHEASRRAYFRERYEQLGKLYR